MPETIANTREIEGRHLAHNDDLWDDCGPCATTKKTRHGADQGNRGADQSPLLGRQQANAQGIKCDAPWRCVMTWFRVDDGFYSHPKVLALSPEAVTLWVRAGSYCGKHLTDGYVGKEALYLLRAEDDHALELVSAGLWIKAVNGYQFHDWADYQDTRDTVEKRRESWRKRQNRHRNGSPLLEEEEPVHSSPFHSTGTRDTTRDTQRESRRDSQPDQFDEFWQHYPRKQGKGAARTAWTKAIAKADAATIIAAAAAYRDDPNREDGFTAHAATWLNQERWDDEPLPSRTDTLSSRERRLKQHLTDDPWATKALGR